MPAIQIAIPIRTRSETNLREHWGTRASRRKKQRDAARTYVRAARAKAGSFEMELILYAHKTIRLTRIAPRRLDSDNLSSSLKAIRDGVADALGVDDGDPRLSWLYEQRKGGPNEYAVEVEVT